MQHQPKAQLIQNQLDPSQTPSTTCSRFSEFQFQAKRRVLFRLNRPHTTSAQSAARCQLRLHRTYPAFQLLQARRVSSQAHLDAKSDSFDHTTFHSPALLSRPNQSPARHQVRLQGSTINMGTATGIDSLVRRARRNTIRLGAQTSPPERRFLQLGALGA